MNIFALLRLFGKSFVAAEIKSALDHHFSAAGKANLASNLEDAAKALAAGDDAAAASALADVVLSIH